jgi:DNA-3-methyladenine glycosylase II
MIEVSQPIRMPSDQIVDSSNIYVTAYQNRNLDDDPTSINSRTLTLKEEIIAKLTQMLGVYADLTDFYENVGTSSAWNPDLLAPLITKFRGMKPPRFPTIFECLINAFACQQVSLTVGINLLNRLSSKFGLRMSYVPTRLGESLNWLNSFPRPKDILQLKRPEEELRAIGFSGQKTRAILELSQLVDEKKIDLERLNLLENNEKITSVLCNLRGVGRWTAEYVLLRGLGRLDVFPADDVGAKKNLQKSLGITKSLSYEEVRGIISKWHPYGGLMYFHLLLENLMAKGWLQV